MDNKKLPISEIKPFLEEAEKLGCYNKSQRYNFGTVWRLMGLLPHDDLSETSTIEQLRPKVETLLKQHGRSNKISAKSLKAYQARINRVLDDFVKHHGGDFMAWKEEKLASTSTNDDTKSRRRRKVTRTREDSNVVIKDEQGMRSDPLMVRNGAEGKIILPTNLSDSEVDAVWAQLDALKALIKARLAALGKTNPKV